MPLIDGSMVTAWALDRRNFEKQQANISEVVLHHDPFIYEPCGPGTGEAVSLILLTDGLDLVGNAEVRHILQVVASFVGNAYRWRGVPKIDVEVPHHLLANVDNAIERTVRI